MEVDDFNARGEIETEISAVENELKALDEEQAQVTRDQQKVNQEQQTHADLQSVRRAEIQASQAALEPEKQSHFSELAAEEARLNNELQRIQRDGGRPSSYQTTSQDERIEAEDRIQGERDDLTEKRAQIEDELAKKSADLHSKISSIEIDATRANTEVNRRNRDLQEILSELNIKREFQQRKLESLRGKLNTIVTEETARSEGNEAERVAASRAREVEEQLATISQDRDELARQVKDLAPLVEAQRDATSAQGAQNLSEFYIDSADQHRRSWRRWLIGMVLAIVIAGVGGLLTVNHVEPDANATSRELFHAITVAILVIGLLVYLVRVFSLQFRVHRNLEAVDRSKAAALRTYNRIVAGGSSPEIRTTLVASLADAVFRTADPGFIDQSSDHITLIERVVGSATQSASRIS